jgi:hypothetical protein
MAVDKPDQISLTAFDLLSRFMRLRQNGVNRDEAWYQVCESAPNTNEVMLKAFLNLAKGWERREGHKYRYAVTKTDETLPREDVPVVKKGPGQLVSAPPASVIQPLPGNPVTPAKPAVQPAPGKPAPPLNQGLTGTLDPGKLREYEQQRLENILDQLEDEPDEPAKPAPITVAIEPPAAAQPEPHEEAPKSRTAPIGLPRDHFGPRTALLMYFKARPEPLRVTINGEAELFIGRATANAAMSPEIDLNPVNAGNYGVSRMHSAITRRNNQLLITDLDSMNHTFVNGVRLLPNEVRVLNDGDEVWFGQLYCRIRFQQF